MFNCYSCNDITSSSILIEKYEVYICKRCINKIKKTDYEVFKKKCLKFCKYASKNF